MIVKRNRRKVINKTRKVYFTKETQDSIVLYIQEPDTIKKNKIYAEKICEPFNKLVENTINNNAFPYIRESYEDIHHEVIYHLLINIDKYDDKKGKAFSYFGTIAKNYLVSWNDKEYMNSKLQSDLEVLDYGRNIQSELSQEIRQEDVVVISDLLIEYFDNNMDVIFKKKRDIDILNAIIVLLRRREFIDNFNKKALYLRIRDLTGYKTHYITKVVNKIRPIYKNIIKEFYRTGTVITKRKNRFI